MVVIQNKHYLTLSCNVTKLHDRLHHHGFTNSFNTKNNKGFFCCVLIKSEFIIIKGTLELRPQSYNIISIKPPVHCFTLYNMTTILIRVCLKSFFEHIQYFIQVENQQRGQMLCFSLIKRFTHLLQVRGKCSYI